MNKKSLVLILALNSIQAFADENKTLNFEIFKNLNSNDYYLFNIQHIKKSLILNYNFENRCIVKYDLSNLDTLKINCKHESKKFYSVYTISGNNFNIEYKIDF